MEFIEFFKEYMGEAITAFIIGFSTWFFARQKNKIDLEGGELANIESNLTLYQKIIDDIDSRYKVRMNEYEEEIRTLRGEIEELRQQVVKCQNCEFKDGTK